MPEITYADFERVDIRVGKIVKVEDFPRARKPAYQVWVDFGELGVKKSSAQATQLYKKDELEGRLVLAVVNFPPRQVADFMSEILILGVPGESAGDVVLVKPDVDVPLGGKLF
ncbi:MAG: tRNA-binding protein [Acidobacteriales bacterium]|nr:tRNA-binding protein [Terriglobales bacterium]